MNPKFVMLIILGTIYFDVVFGQQPQNDVNSQMKAIKLGIEYSDFKNLNILDRKDIEFKSILVEDKLIIDLTKTQFIKYGFYKDKLYLIYFGTNNEFDSKLALNEIINAYGGVKCDTIRSNKGWIETYEWNTDVISVEYIYQLNSKNATISIQSKVLTELIKQESKSFVKDDPELFKYLE